MGVPKTVGRKNFYKENLWSNNNLVCSKKYVGQESFGLREKLGAKIGSKDMIVKQKFWSKTVLPKNSSF